MSDAISEDILDEEFPPADEDEDTTEDSGTSDGDAPDAPAVPDGEDPGSDDAFGELQGRLEQLEEEKSEFEEQSVDANIADLTKLIADATKAKKDYEDAYADLKAEDDRLKSFKNNTKPDLEHILQTAGVDAVKQIVADAVSAIEAATENVRTLKGYVPVAGKPNEKWRRGEVGDAELALEQAKTELAKKETKLDHLRGLAKAVGDRHKAMKAAETEILKLGRSGQPATAYWLLTQAELKDKFEHVVIEGDTFFSGMVEPQVIKSNKLEDEIWAAWKEFETARQVKTAAEATLKTKQNALKEAEKTLSDLKKDIGKTIKDALAEWETDRVNPAA